MRRILLPVLFFFAFISIAFSQERSSLSITERYAHERDSILHAVKRGEYLYKHSDAFRRLVDLHVRALLGLEAGTDREPGHSELPMSTDTSYVKDVTNNSYDQDETTVAINRKSKNIVAAGANDDNMYTSGMPAYYSTDFGKSWKSTRVPRPADYPPLGDPVITTDDSGNFYYAYLAGDFNSYTSTIYVGISSDGKKWKNLNPVHETLETFVDKEHITIDCSHQSPYYGRIYVVWYNYDDVNGNYGVTINWSDDKGQSWTPNLTLDLGDNFQEVKTGPHGEIYVSYTSQYDVGQGMIVSLDGGANWESHSVFSDFVQYPVVASIGRSGLKGDYGFRSFAYTTFDVDLKTGRIHMVYGTYLDDVKQAAALYYTYSDDKGTGWSTPRPVGVPNAQSSLLYYDRFMPWVSVDQSTGDAYAMYYSSERDQDNLLTSAFRTRLSATMSDPALPMEATDFDPTATGTDANGQYPFIGDYNGSDAYDSVYAASWTRNRANHSDGDVFVYVSSPHSAGTNSVNASLVHSDGLWLSEPYPNPLTGSEVTISYYSPKNTDIHFALYDTRGAEIRSFGAKHIEEGTQTESLSVAGIPAGTYYLKLTSPIGEVMKQVVVVK